MTTVQPSCFANATQAAKTHTTNCMSACKRYATNFTTSVKSLASRIADFMKVKWAAITSYIKANPDASKKGLFALTVVVLGAVLAKYSNLFESKATPNA